MKQFSTLYPPYSNIPENRVSPFISRPYTGIFLILLVLSLLEACSNAPVRPETQQGAASVFAPADKLEIQAPFKGIDVPAQTFLVNPARDTVLRTASNSSVRIPAGIFIDEQQKSVQGVVEIRFTEYREVHEIIASGIPMSVRRPEGHDDWMQTAGMFDIYGSQAGKPIFVAPGQFMEVRLQSPVDGNYPFWRFDSEAGNWQLLHETPPAPVSAGLAPQEREKVQKEVQQLRQRTATRPQKPFLNDGSYETVENTVDPDELARFPELRNRKDIVWLYIGTSENRPGNLPKTAFYPAELAAGPHNGTYWMTLKSNKDKFKLLVRPALTGAEIAHAQDAFEAAEKEYQELTRLLAQKEALLKEQVAFERSISVGTFGVFNYDILTKNPESVQLAADFDFGEQHEAVKRLITVFCITGNDKVVVKLPYSDWKNFRYTPGKSMHFVAVLPDNKMAVLSQDEFVHLQPQLPKTPNSPYTFHMRVLDRAPATLADVKQAYQASL